MGRPHAAMAVVTGVDDVAVPVAPRERAVREGTVAATATPPTITLLEGRVQPSLESGRRPDRKEGRQVAEILRTIARELE